MNQENDVDFILRWPDVRAKVALCRSTVYLKISNGTFPKPIKLSERAVGWLESDIDNWLQQRIKISKGGDHLG